MKQIEDNILSIFKIMFLERDMWEYVTDDQKIKYFFIINRNLSKKYPEKAQLLNLKSINKVLAMDTWYYFMLDKPYPKWFWSKSEQIKEKPKITDKDFQLLVQKLGIKPGDVEYLVTNFPEFIKEELNYYKKLEKQ
jgi:hypothetical protein